MLPTPGLRCGAGTRGGSSVSEPGRPTKCASDLQQKFVEALELGCHRSGACKYAGLSRSTFAEWMRRGARGEAPFAEFRTAVETGEARAEVLATGVIFQAVRGGDWKAATEWLSRRYPDRWSRVDRFHHQLVIPVPAAERMIHAVVWAVKRHVLDPEVRALIAEDLERELLGEVEELGGPEVNDAAAPMGLGPGRVAEDCV